MSRHSVFVPLSAVVHPSTAETTNSHNRKRLGDRATLGQRYRNQFHLPQRKGMSTRGKIVEISRERHRARITHAKRDRGGIYILPWLQLGTRYGTKTPFGQQPMNPCAKDMTRGIYLQDFQVWPLKCAAW